MMTIWYDVRYGLRQLVKNPLFSFIAILMLALGVGANTAVFSLLNSVLLRPLPVRNPDELRGVNWVGDFCPNIHGRVTSTPNGEQISNTFTYPAFCEFRDQGTKVAEFFAYLGFKTFDPPTIQTRDQVFTADGMMVSGNFFQVLGLEPVLGRTIMPEDDQPNVSPVAVISYHAWQKYFSGNRNVIGQTIVLKQVSATVVGVLPEGFLGVEKGRRRDIYVPLVLQPRIEGICALESPDYWWVEVMARVKPSVDDLQVSHLLGAIFTRMTEETVVDASEKKLRIIITDGSGGLSGNLAPKRLMMAKPLYVLFGLVGIVLLVTCVNLAGLLLARGVMRHHEFAVRTALGAQRGRLIRQLLTESIVLSLIGVGCGFLLATWIKPVLANILWSSDTIVNLQSDLSVCGFVLTILVFTTILFGLLPALRVTRTNPVIHLKHKVMLGAPRLRLSKILISIQVALSLLLLVAAGLFTRTLINILRVETGFNIENVLVFRVDTSKRHAVFTTAISSLPGVQAVTYSGLPLLNRGRSSTTIPLPGESSGKLNILKLNVGETFLQTMGIPLLAGRDFKAVDTETLQRTIVINRFLAESAFPEENPIGNTLRIHQKDYTIVGVCGNTKYYDLKMAYEPIVFFPSRQGLFFMVHTKGNPQSLLPSIRQILASVNPGVALSAVKTLKTQIHENTLQERSFAWLASSLAFLAVLQSCIGLYGLMAQIVTRRTSEIGIRMAIGATPLAVAWPVLRSALLMAMTGMIISVPVILAIVRIIRSYLFGIVPYDPITLVGAIVLLFVVVIMAAWIPARRAAKIDPMEALRYE